MEGDKAVVGIQRRQVHRLVLRDGNGRYRVHRDRILRPLVDIARQGILGDLGNVSAGVGGGRLYGLFEVERDDIPAVEMSPVEVRRNDDRLQLFLILDDLEAHLFVVLVRELIQPGDIVACLRIVIVAGVLVFVKLVAQEHEGLARRFDRGVFMGSDPVNRKALRGERSLAAAGDCQRHFLGLAAVRNMLGGQLVLPADGKRDPVALEADVDRAAAFRLELAAVRVADRDVVGVQHVLAVTVSRLCLGAAVQRHPAAQRHGDAVLRIKREGLLCQRVADAHGNGVRDKARREHHRKDKDQ